MAADDRDAVVDHHRLGVQTDALAFLVQGHRRGRARAGVTEQAWSVAGFGFLFIDPARLTTDTHISRDRKRFEFVNAEAELAQVQAFVFVRERIHREGVGGGQRIGRHPDLHRLLAPLQTAEGLPGQARHHQVRGLQQHTALRLRNDLVHRIGGARPAAGFIGVLFRKIGVEHRITHRAPVRRQRRHQARTILRHRGHGVHACRIIALRHLQTLWIGLRIQQYARHIIQLRCRHAALAVPEGVEVVAHAVNRRAGHPQVAVAVVVALAPIEIAVLDVAAADHRHAVVHQQQLGVHALVETLETEHDAGEEFGLVGFGLVEHRAVQTQFEIAVQGRQLGLQLRPAQAVQLVEQQTHFHPALGGTHHRIQHQRAGFVEVVDEHLQFDAVARALDHVQAGQQGVVALIKQDDLMFAIAGGACGGIGQITQGRIQPATGFGLAGIAGVLHGAGKGTGLPVLAFGQAGAGAQRQHQHSRGKSNDHWRILAEIRPPPRRADSSGRRACRSRAGRACRWPKSDRSSPAAGIAWAAR